MAKKLKDMAASALEKGRQAMMQGLSRPSSDISRPERVDSRLGAAQSVTGKVDVAEKIDVPEIEYSPATVQVRTLDSGKTIVYDPQAGKGKGFLIDSAKGSALLKKYGVSVRDVAGKNTVGFGGEPMEDADVIQPGKVGSNVFSQEQLEAERTPALPEAPSPEDLPAPERKPGEEAQGDVIPAGETAMPLPEGEDQPATLMTEEQEIDAQKNAEFFTNVFGDKEGQEVQQLEQRAASKVEQSKLDDAREAYKQGVLNKEEYKKYLERVAPSAEEVAVEGLSNEIDYTKPSDIQATDYLNSFPSSSGAEFSSSMSAFGDPQVMSSAEFMTQMVAEMKMEDIDENLAISRSIFDNARKSAVAAYEGALNAGANAISEIDAIDRGVSSVTSTAKSLAVRIAKQSKDLSTASIEAREDLLSTEYQITYSNMVEQNGRLEGYMKAKLNYMGAATSSAGLTLMATTINKAQQNLLMLNGRFTEQMTQLELKKTELMQGYLNAVEEQLISIDEARDGAAEDLTGKLDEIDANQLASESEASTMRLTALSDLAKDMYKIENDKKEWEWKLYTDQWDMAMEETKFVNDIQQQAKSDAQDSLSLMLQAGMGKGLGQLPADMQEAMLTMAAIAGLPDSYVSQALDSQRQKLMSGVKKEGNSYGLEGKTSEFVAGLVADTINGDVSPSKAGAMISQTVSKGDDRAAAYVLYQDQYAYYSSNPFNYFRGPAAGARDIPTFTAEQQDEFSAGFIEGSAFN